MTISGAPSGADVSSASSSAAATPAPTGPPSRGSLTAQLKATKAGIVKSEPASTDDEKQTDAALGAPDSGKKTEGDTAAPEAGKGDKPVEKKEQDGDPPWLRERLGREKKHREKVEAELHAVKGDAAKVRLVMDAMATENERLQEQLAKQQGFDERGEELHGLKLQQQVKDQIAKMESEHQQALVGYQRDQQVSELAAQMRSEVQAACADFPLVSSAEVIAALRRNPKADIRQVAQATHEGRRALATKQSGAQPAASLPSTVDKPTGVAKFQSTLDRKGMTLAFKHARAKS